MERALRSRCCQNLRRRQQSLHALFRHQPAGEQEAHRLLHLRVPGRARLGVVEDVLGIDPGGGCHKRRTPPAVELRSVDRLGIERQIGGRTTPAGQSLVNGGLQALAHRQLAPRGTAPGRALDHHDDLLPRRKRAMGMASQPMEYRLPATPVCTIPARPTARHSRAAVIGRVASAENREAGAGKGTTSSLPRKSSARGSKWQRPGGAERQGAASTKRGRYARCWTRS